jgi:hypothetical protein
MQVRIWLSMKSHHDETVEMTAEQYAEWNRKLDEGEATSEDLFEKFFSRTDPNYYDDAEMEIFEAVKDSTAQRRDEHG